MKCACGCGNETPIATKTDSRRNQKKGQPMRYLPGHNAGTGGASNIGLSNAPGEITERDIENLRGADDLQAADVYDARVRALERSHRRSFVEMGLICNEVSDRSLWAKLANPETRVYYHSFDDWLLSAAGVSRSSAYSAMKTLKALSSVPIDELREMPRCNAVTLAGLSSAVQKKPKMIEAAKTMSEKDFIAEVQRTEPHQHVESKSEVKLKPSASARAVMDEAIAAAMWIFGVESREDAIEAALIAWLEESCPVEGMQEFTIREAFQKSSVRAA